jgi:hypothetical protein
MRLDRTILSLALLGTAVAVPALAQQSPSLSTYPECTVTPSKDDSEAAHNAYLFGKRKFDEAEYATAVNYFKDAYKTDCKKHEILVIISRSYELSGNKAEAVNALEVYLKRVPDAPDADGIKKRIGNLKAGMAPAASSTTAPSATIAPTTSATAAPSATTTAAAPPSATLTAPIPPRDEGSIAPWILVGAGGVAIVAGVVLLAVGSGQVSTANSDFKNTPGCDVAAHTCKTGKPGEPTPDGVQSLNDKLQGGYRNETIGGVVLGVGVAAVAGGLVWHFAFDKPKPKDSQAAGVVVRPGFAPGWVGLGGAF